MRYNAQRRLQVWALDRPVPIRMPCGKAYVHRLVLFDQVGWGPHPCYWCGRLLEWVEGLGGITVDHLTDVRCVVSCQRCNRVRETGLLDLRFPERAVEILRWSTIKTHFPCGHPVGYDEPTDNIFVKDGTDRSCLVCHRRRARDYDRALRASRVA